MPNPCKDCTKRIIGCHSKCPDYAKHKEKRELEKQSRPAYIATYREAKTSHVSKNLKAKRGKY